VDLVAASQVSKRFCAAATSAAADETDAPPCPAGYGAAPAVAILHEHAEAVVAHVLAENERRWEELGEADRERVGVLARTIARRLLHEPTRRLRADGEARASVALEFFGLAAAHGDEPPAAVSLQRGRARS
jgi:glutamyl-tRNA reductase